MIRWREETGQAGSGAGAAVPQIGIVADDLTGACDAAVAFTGVSPDVRVELQPGLQAPCGVWAVSTDSRDLDGECAERSLRAAVGHLSQEAELFKKVDSAFRGNTALEIAALVRCFPASLVVLAPAYPALGRHVLDATLHVEDLNCVREIPLQSQLETYGCATVRLPATTDEAMLAAQMSRSLNTGSRTLLCDATTNSHLTAIVRAARSLRVSTVWVGSGGLAHALAGECAPLRQPGIEISRRGDTIFFIGSDHAATRGQVLHLQRLTGLAKSGCSGPANASAGGMLLAVPRGETEQNIRQALSEIKPGSVGCLFMTGGDTARLVCRALGIVSLRLQAEFAPGVPVGLAEGGPFAGVPVVLKSGAFGSRDLLRQVLEAFSGEEAMPA